MLPNEASYLARTCVCVNFGINPNPPCQRSLWEETGETGENPRGIRQSVDNKLFPRAIRCSMHQDLEPLTSVVEGCRLRRLSHRI